MSPWWMRPDQEEPKAASGSHRAAGVLDTVLLILGPILLILYVVEYQRFDTWDILVGLYILITWLLRVNARLKKKGAR